MQWLDKLDDVLERGFRRRSERLDGASEPNGTNEVLSESSDGSDYAIPVNKGFKKPRGLPGRSKRTPVRSKSSFESVGNDPEAADRLPDKLGNNAKPSSRRQNSAQDLDGNVVDMGSPVQSNASPREPHDSHMMDDNEPSQPPEIVRNEPDITSLNPYRTTTKDALQFALSPEPATPETLFADFKTPLQQIPLTEMKRRHHDAVIGLNFRHSVVDGEDDTSIRPAGDSEQDESLIDDLSSIELKEEGWSIDSVPSNRRLDMSIQTLDRMKSQGESQVESNESTIKEHEKQKLSDRVPTHRERSRTATPGRTVSRQRPYVTPTSKTVTLDEPLKRSGGHAPRVTDCEDEPKQDSHVLRPVEVPTVSVNKSTTNGDEAQPNNRTRIPRSDSKSEPVERSPRRDRTNQFPAKKQTDVYSGNISLPSQIEFRPEFEVTWASEKWNQDDFDQNLARNLNCLGAVHVRLLRAKRLPCSPGSRVQAIVSLIPWSGKVRLDYTRSFAGPRAEDGVCLRWEEDEVSPVSVVHAWAGRETPIPVLRIDLMSTLFGFFEECLCSFEVDCAILIVSPGISRRQWFLISDLNTMGSDESPLIELEAMFEPASKSTAVDTDEVATEEKSFLATIPDERSYSVVSQSLHSKRDDVRAMATKRHLLSARKIFRPATCSICNRNLMSGFRSTKAFHCDECCIDCCEDCRVQVDLELPCGSSKARRVVQASIQNKLTPSAIMNTVAPIEEKLMKQNESLHSKGDNELSNPVVYEIENDSSCLGWVRVVVGEGRIFEETLPQQTVDPDADDKRPLQQGDYYLRLHVVGDESLSTRTPTVQSSGRLSFEACGELGLPVPHFGAEFCLELVDANLERPSCLALFTTQSILQAQRDKHAREQFLPFSIRPMLTKEEFMPFPLDFREGISAKDYFSSKQRGDSDIKAIFQARILLKENVDSLFGNDPLPCPDRPPERFDLNTFQQHISRVVRLISLCKGYFDTVHYIVSWRSVFVTAMSLSIFLVAWYNFDSQYFLHAPVLFLLCHMLFFAWNRNLMSSKSRVIGNQVEIIRNTERTGLGYTVHRPVGLASIRVTEGKNLHSLDSGLAGFVSYRVYWDPMRLIADEKQRSKVGKTDRAANTTHVVAQSRPVNSSTPQWQILDESDTTRRLIHLLPHGGDFFQGATSTNQVDRVLFPILQPINVIGSDQISLAPWSRLQGALVIEVRMRDFLSVAQISEYIYGEVVVPISLLVERQLLRGWYPVTTMQSSGFTVHQEKDKPQLFLDITWSPPESLDHPSLEAERELSLVIQEEFIRSAMIQKHASLGIIGSSMGAFKTMAGLSDTILTVQSTLGFTLDLVESTKNLFNFTDPFRSTWALIAVLSLWVILWVVPSNIIILLVGLGLYAGTFFDRFGYLFLVPDHITHRELPKTEGLGGKGDSMQRKRNHIATWLSNAFKGIPTDEDLRKAFFWDCRKALAQEQERQAERKRSSRLEKLWRAQWYSMMYLLVPVEKSVDLTLKPVFCIVQGHRFLWWGSVRDFDEGNKVMGHIFLRGHAGLATPSPLELKLFEKDELPRLTCIFGKGDEEQQRLTMLAPTVDVKSELEHSIVFAVTHKND